MKDVASSTLSPVSYVEASLTPSQIIVGEPVQFQLVLSNPNSIDITLDSMTSLHFTGDNDQLFSASLITPTVIVAGHDALVRFHMEIVSPGFHPGTSNPVLDLSGKDANGQAFTQTLIPSAQVSILPNQSSLTEVSNTFQPTEPSRQSMVVFWISMENTTNCPIRLDSSSELVLKDGQQWLQQTPLYKPVTIQPGETERLDFGTLDKYGFVSSHIKDEIPDGIYQPHFRLFGERTCDSSQFSEFFDSNQSLTLNPLTGDTGGAASGSFVHSITQAGAVIELWMQATASDPYQILVQGEVASSDRCYFTSIECLLLPEDYFFLGHEFAYLQGPHNRALINLLVKPTSGMASDLPWELTARLYKMTRHPGTGVGIRAGVRPHVALYIAQRNGSLNVAGLEPENTFIRQGESFNVNVWTGNYNTGEPNYPIHPLADSRLLLSTEGIDVSSEFHQIIENPGIAVHQQDEQAVHFNVTPTGLGPTAKITIDAFVSTEGVYPYYFNTFGVTYPGPDMVTIPNNVVASTFIEPGFVYLVDEIPLEVVDESKTLAIGSQFRTLQIEVRNTSNWSFSVGPDSFVELPLQPKQSVLIDTMGPVSSTALAVCRTDWAQSFIPDVSFDLTEIDFTLAYAYNGIVPEDIQYVVELVPANVHGALPVSADMTLPSESSIATERAFVPAGTQAEANRIQLQTAPLNVRLEQGREYYAIFRFGNPVCMYGTFASVNAYPQGKSYIRRPSAGLMKWLPEYGDLALKFHGRNLIYRAQSILSTPVTIESNQTAVVPFEFSQPFADVLDGSYTPEVRLYGTGANTEEVFEYHQQLVTSTPFVRLDSVQPIASVSPLPALQNHPEFVVSWSGTDDATGILNYDVQVKTDGGEWTDWLVEASSTEKIFTAISGHRYAFRIRARDGAHNVSPWTEAIETQIAYSHPEIQGISAPSAAQPVNTTVSVEATFSDPDVGDSHTAEWDWGDGSSSIGTVTGHLITGSHSYAEPGIYILKVTVRDAGGLEDDLSYQDVIIYVPVDAGPDQTTDEGNAISLSAIVAGYDISLLTYLWDLDNDGVFESQGQNISFNPLDGPGTYNVTVRATAPTGPSATDSATVTVNNLAPIVGPVSAPNVPVPVGTEVNTSADFVDTGVLDTHTAEWDWGDDSSSAGTVTETGGSGSVSNSHSYNAPGVYTIQLTVTDKDGDATVSIYQYVVVYDPDGGFVTGGGWIWSEPGWCQLDDLCADAEGQANFGFVSKYKKGASVPTGNTEFNFKAGGLSFHSDEYEWLVITGSNYARYKGSGTISGEVAPTGELYKFQIWAGDETDSGGEDTFRIKIWYEDSGSEIIVYDNGMDQAIGGGNIKVHQLK